MTNLFTNSLSTHPLAIPPSCLRILTPVSSRSLLFAPPSRPRVALTCSCQALPGGGAFATLLKTLVYLPVLKDLGVEKGNIFRLLAEEHQGLQTSLRCCRLYNGTSINSPTSFPALFPFELGSKGKSPGNEVVNSHLPTMATSPHSRLWSRPTFHTLFFSSLKPRYKVHLSITATASKTLPIHPK